MNLQSCENGQFYDKEKIRTADFLNPFEIPEVIVKNTSEKIEVSKVNMPCVGWLVVLNGLHIGTDFRLKEGKNFIGRSSQMDIALLEEKSVSRNRQAIIVYEPKQHLYMVQPGEASTLVYKNNEVVLSPMNLSTYDVITVGEVNLLFISLCNKEYNWNDLFRSKEKISR